MWYSWARRKYLQGFGLKTRRKDSSWEIYVKLEGNGKSTINFKETGYDDMG
jgi:hypothetical protein